MAEKRNVSVIIINSSRNAEWFAAAMESLKNQQTNLDFEVIEVKNPGRSQTIGECYAAGVKRAKYEYIFILDDDDFLCECAIQMHYDKIEELRAKDPKYWQVCCNQMLVNDDDKIVGYWNVPNQGIMVKDIILELGNYPTVSWREIDTNPTCIHSDVRLQISAVKAGYKSFKMSSAIYAYRVHRKGASVNVNRPIYEEILANGNKLKEGDKPPFYDQAVEMTLDKIPDYEKAMESTSKQYDDSITIGIITWNNALQIVGCIKAIRTHTKGMNYRIVVIDNASTDKTLQMINIAGGVDKVIKNKKNVGYPKAVNQLFKEAETDHILLLNPDIYVSADWLRTMLVCMKSHENSKCGIVGCRIVLSDGVTECHMGTGFHPSNWSPINLTNLKWSNVPKEIFTQGTTWACALFKKEIYKKFEADESYGMGYYEDANFNLQVIAAGYSIWVTPFVTVQHEIHSSFNQVDKKKLDKVLTANYKRFMEQWEGKLIASARWLKPQL